MSKIDDLIKQYCPNGVEYKELGELGVFENIGVDKKTLPNEKLVKLLNYMDVYKNQYIDATIPQMTVSASDKKILQCSVEKGDIFITPTSETKEDIGHSAVILETITDCCYSYHLMRYRLNEMNMTTSFYIRYLFEGSSVQKQIYKYAKGLTRYGLSKYDFAKIKIPVPPMPVQEEIVKVLDAFTALEAELEAELEARKRQYEYYRNKLLTFDENTTGGGRIKFMQLGDVCDIQRGRRLTKNQLLVDGKFPVYHGGIEPLGYYDQKNREKDTVMVINVGASAGTVGYSDVDFWSSDGCFCLSHSELYLNKYVYYALKTKEQTLQSKVRKAGVPTLDNSVVEKTIIPIPPLDEQERIVAILDKFDSLVNDISEGLPAELNARRQQYEYYRNKLLTFDEAA